MKRGQKQKGFTIVELLIVIVVIGVLAAITVVSFNGVKQKARNNAKIAAATAWVKSLDSSTLSTGQHFGHQRVCLPIGNTDVNGDGLGDCGNVTDAMSVTRSETAAANNDLANRGLRNLSFPVDAITDSAGNKFAGLEHGNSASTYGIDGLLQPRFLIFYLEGTDVDCGSSYSIDYVGGSDPLRALAPAKNASTANGVTTCNYTLKDRAGI